MPEWHFHHWLNIKIFLGCFLPIILLFPLFYFWYSLPSPPPLHTQTYTTNPPHTPPHMHMYTHTHTHMLLFKVWVHHGIWILNLESRCRIQGLGTWIGKTNMPSSSLTSNWNEYSILFHYEWRQQTTLMLTIFMPLISIETHTFSHHILKSNLCSSLLQNYGSYETSSRSCYLTCS